jgi:hypothetical protein
LRYSVGAELPLAGFRDRSMSRTIALFRRLWAGDEPLSRAFWEFAICYGLALNLATTLASMGAAASGQPGALILALYALPLPYNLFIVVAVWRSAAHYAGRRLWADLARPFAVLWAVLLTLA